MEVFNGKESTASNLTTGFPNVAQWRIFLLADLFEIKKGTRLTKAEMTPGETPFIGSVNNNNGLTGFVGQLPNHPANTLTVNYDGSVAEAFYQPKPYRALDSVNVLYPKFDLTPAIGLFIATVIRQEKYRFSYGRKWHLERMEQSEIRLPATTEGKPDFKFMENYIRSLPFSAEAVRLTDAESTIHYKPQSVIQTPETVFTEVQTSIPY